MEKDVVVVSPAMLLHNIECASMLLSFHSFMELEGELLIYKIFEEKRKIQKQINVLEKNLNEGFLQNIDSLFMLVHLKEKFEYPCSFQIGDSYYALDVQVDIDDFGFFPVKEKNDKNVVAISLYKFENNDNFQYKNVISNCVFTYNVKSSKVQDIYYFEHKDSVTNKVKKLVLE